MEDSWKSMTMNMSAEDWASLRDDELRVVCDGRHVVCAVWGGQDDDEVKAADLIAAAPEMYKALNHLTHWHDQLSSADIAKAQAALAKARGEAQPV